MTIPTVMIWTGFALVVLMNIACIAWGAVLGREGIGLLIGGIIGLVFSIIMGFLMRHSIALAGALLTGNYFPTRFTT